ncbi:MAG: dUTP diphosphatase [Bacteroidaceae bacterium]|nr:dUTP diphosphatase [Bacteroidaceae bacterium]
MEVKVKKLHPAATIPTFGSDEAAGCDLYANLAEEGGMVVIRPGTKRFIKTGIAMAIPKGYGGFLYARSGLACKQGLRPANCVGVIDSDYRGELIVALYNDSNEERTVSHGDRIAQLVITAYLRPAFVETEELDDTERGAGGFGHTGV